MQQLNVWKHVKYKNVVLHMRQYYESGSLTATDQTNTSK